MPRRTHGLPLAAASAALVLVACRGGEARAPTELMDGSAVPPLRVQLDEVDRPVFLTRGRVRAADEVAPASAAASCVRERGRGTTVTGLIVERVGVQSETVTFQVGGGRALVACDNAPGPREGGERWCGGAFGVLADGRLLDPRLDILCSTADGEPLAIVWVEPQPETRFVAVEQPAFTEVYETAAGLPVRVSSASGVDVERASAELAISEHDASGALVRRYELLAAVSG
jgi:hypothetical protein